MKNIKQILVIMALMVSQSLMAQRIELPAPNTDGGESLMLALKHRHTVRSFNNDELPMDQLSSLLWAAYGYNRPEELKRTAPSARNVQETDLYVFMTDGIYLYDAKENALNLVVKGDYRASISSQRHFAEAPVALVLVANYDRMKDFDADSRDFYAAVDCGYVSQNIYLYCAAFAPLGTVACGAINRDKIAQLLNLKNGKPMLAHPIGFVK